MPLKPIKPFINYSQQINKLINDKGLIIHDIPAAENMLTDLSYYALIDGYKDIFYNRMNRKYLPGTTIDDIIIMYQFDKAFRELYFKYICVIEQKMRSLISYHFCERHGNDQSEYLDPSNYLNTRRNRSDINKLVHILSREVNISNEHPYVVYQRNTYGNVPLHVATKTLTFGQMSKMYSLLPATIKTRISLHFKNTSERELAQHLRVLGDYRNVCAHNERLYNHIDRNEIPDTKLHDKLGIPKRGSQYIFGKKDSFSVVISLRYLLPRKDFISFKKELASLIRKSLRQSNILTENTLLSTMGFPFNWKNITRYQL